MTFFLDDLSDILDDLSEGNPFGQDISDRVDALEELLCQMPPSDEHVMEKIREIRQEMECGVINQNESLYCIYIQYKA